MFILYMVIGFGIFGTMLMMVAERMHVGVLIAIGMKRINLAVMVLTESYLVDRCRMIGAFPCARTGISTRFNLIRKEIWARCTKSTDWSQFFRLV